MKTKIYPKKFSAVLVLLALGTSLAATAQVVVTKNGVKYTLNADEASYSATGYTPATTDAVIESSIDGKKVTAIADSAFHNSRLESVILSNTIETIGVCAFRNCTALKTITVNKGANLTLRRRCFENCAALESFTVPSTVAKFDNNGQFKDCASLSDLTFEENDKLTALGGWMLEKCTSLKTVDLSPLTKVKTLTGTFEDCGIETVTLPAQLTTIGEYTFQRCKALKALTIPAGVTSIGKYAFEECTSLTALSLPEGLITLKDHAFKGAGIEQIHFPATLTSIEGYAFEASKLRNAVIMSDVKFGDGVFYNNPQLQSLTLPATLTTITRNLVVKCPMLQSVYLPGNVPASVNADVVSALISNGARSYVKPSYLEAYKSAMPAAADMITDQIPLSLTAGMTTFSCGFDADFSATTGLEAYVAQSYDNAEGKVVMQKADKIAAATGVVLKGTPGEYIFRMSDDTPAAVSNLLKASADNVFAGTGKTAYELSGDSFQKTTAKFMDAGTAYLSLPEGTTADTVGLNFDIANGINAVPAASVQHDDYYYTTSGVRTLHPSNGVYIHNGKKVLITK